MEQEKTNLENVVEADDEFFAVDDKETLDQDDLFDTEDSQEESKPETPSTLKIKYNGAEEELDLVQQQDLIVELVQKGKNYDHIKEELETLKNSPEKTRLDKIAKEVGAKSVDEFIAKIEQDMANQKIDKRVEELVADGMSEKHAKEFAKLELEKSTKEAEPEPEDEAKPDDGLEASKNQFMELFAEYPELTKLSYEDYPQEVKDMMEEGKSPLIAYQKYLLDKEKKEKEQLLHNSKVKERDIGGLKKGKEDDKDDFASEFDKY